MRFISNRTQFLPHDRPELESSKFVILPVPYERTTSYMKGTRKGPAAVMAASHQVELWDEEVKRETWKDGIFTLAPFDCSGTEKAFFARLESGTEQLISSVKALPVFIGGEHSITQALIPPFQRKYRGLSILHFDAHADLRTTFCGSSHSHACALYPASRLSPVVQVGIRSVGHDERQYADAGRVKTFLMHENLDQASLRRKVLGSLTDKVYISIDVDGFDPSVMPGTGTPQPGGFSWYDALDLFRAVCLNKKVVGFDVVEVCPLKGSPITEFNAAKLIYRLMGYLSR